MTRGGRSALGGIPLAKNEPRGSGQRWDGNYNLLPMIRNPQNRRFTMSHYRLTKNTSNTFDVRLRALKWTILAAVSVVTYLDYKTL